MKRWKLWAAFNLPKFMFGNSNKPNGVILVINVRALLLRVCGDMLLLSRFSKTFRYRRKTARNRVYDIEGTHFDSVPSKYNLISIAMYKQTVLSRLSIYCHDSIGQNWSKSSVLVNAIWKTLEFKKFNLMCIIVVQSCKSFHNKPSSYLLWLWM